MTARLSLALSVLLVCCLVSAVYAADGQTGFEEWFGYNYQPIGGSIMGLSFGSTASGSDALFANITATTPGGHSWYSMTSDNGKVTGDGEYFISGNVAAIVMDGYMKIAITGDTGAKEITLGISNFFDVAVEAYDINNNLISSENSGEGTVGVANLLPNTKTQPVGNPGIGLKYVTVSCPIPKISYILVKSEPGFYVVDNVSYVVPEPGSMVALAVGLMGFVGVIGRKRRN